MARKLLLALTLSSLLLVLFFFAIPARASTIIYVNSYLDVKDPNDGYCTLREAIIAANTDTTSGGAYAECPAGSGADTILLPPGTYTLTIGGVGEDNSATGDLDIKQDVTIQGNGFACGVNPSCTSINGFYNDRVFDITSTMRVTITKLDIVHGRADDSGAGIRNHGVLLLKEVYLSDNAIINFADGGGLYNDSGASATLDTVGFLLNHAYVSGGAIFNAGTLTLTKSLLTLDSAGNNAGGGLYNVGTATISDSTIAYESSTIGGGAGIFNTGNLTLNRVTLDHNQTSGGVGGGAILNGNGAMTLTNVTLSANSTISVTSAGGALLNEFPSIVTFTNVSVVSNTAPSGGGIRNGGTVSLKNTIVAYNTGGNCSGILVSNGYNLSSDSTCTNFSATGDITNTNPLLGPLANNGGATWTHAVPSTSPAINKIPFGTNGCGTTITTDQRGYARVAPCDIGAFEYVLRVFLPLIMR